MQKPVVTLSAMCAACLWVGAANAGVAYSFLFDSPTYIAAPGGKRNVDVYLEEVVGSGGTLVLDPATGVGMFSLGTMVRWDDPPQPTSPATVPATSDITPNAAFDYIVKNVYSDDATLNDALLVNPYVHGTEVASGVYEILIGTFAFTAGTNSGAVTHIRATAYGGGENVNVTGADAPLDSLISDATATITTALAGDADLNGTVNGADLNTVLSNYNQTGMTWAQGDFDGNGTVNGADLNAVLSNYNQYVGVSAAVPEPSALLLGGIAAAAIGAMRFCRRRR